MQRLGFAERLEDKKEGFSSSWMDLQPSPAQTGLSLQNSSLADSALIIQDSFL